MKKILVGTDFSASARNASLYAVELAKKTKSEIILFHAYYIPVPPTDYPVMMNYEDVEAENILMLENEKKFLDPKSEINIRCITVFGAPNDSIVEIEKEEIPDLIIMGLAVSTKLSGFLLGSTTTSLIRNTQTRVLIVPNKAVFFAPARIVFACDYNLASVTDTLKPLKDFAELFNSHILILNLFDKKDLLNSKKNVTQLKVEEYLSKVQHSFYFEKDENFEETINNFSLEHEADIIAVVPHRHNFFIDLFKIHHTKKLAFHTHIPILAIPENTPQ
jgi:nucleotide-binding universal stress UspA family protein